jgi:hypothetical protein
LACLRFIAAGSRWPPRMPDGPANRVPHWVVNVGDDVGSGRGADELLGQVLAAVSASFWSSSIRAKSATSRGIDPVRSVPIRHGGVEDRSSRSTNYGTTSCRTGE